MSNDGYMGKVGKSALGALADKAAERIMTSDGPRAVCMCPQGVVTVERFANAVPDEIIGNYNRDAGRLGLSLLILGDLKEAVAERGLRRGHRNYVRAAA